MGHRDEAGAGAGGSGEADRPQDEVAEVLAARAARRAARTQERAAARATLAAERALRRAKRAAARESLRGRAAAREARRAARRPARASGPGAAPPDELGAAGVRPPRQERSARTLNQLLDAALEVLASAGLEGATVPEIAARAGVSVGSVYRRFADKDALLEAVYERFLERASFADATRLLMADAALPARDVAHLVVDSMVAIYRSKAGLIRALNLYVAQQRDPAFRERVDRFNARTLAGVVELFRPVLHEIRHEQPEAAIRTGLLVVTSTLRQLVMSGQPVPAWLGFDRDGLEKELGRVYARYLGVE